MAGTAEPRRSKEQKAEVTAFLRALLEASPYESQRSFAGAAGIGESEISNWIRGARSLDGYNLLKLIRASGVLREMLGPPTPELVPQELQKENEKLRKQIKRLEAQARASRSTREGRSVDP